MSQAWYFTRGTEREGPVEWPELQKMAASGDLMPDHRVWTEGFSDWMAASAVSDLFSPGAPSQQSNAAAPAEIPPTQVDRDGAQDATAPQPQEAPAAAVAAEFPGVPVVDYTGISGNQVAFAGFWMRFLAALIDGIIVASIGFGLMKAFILFVGEDVAVENAPTLRLFVQGIFLIVGWIYFATLESGATQATLGKSLFGMKVTDLAGNRISFVRASARHFGKFLSDLVFLIGYLIMPFTLNSQCLHDMIAGCVVVKKPVA